MHLILHFVHLQGLISGIARADDRERRATIGRLMDTAIANHIHRTIETRIDRHAVHIRMTHRYIRPRRTAARIRRYAGAELISQR